MINDSNKHTEAKILCLFKEIQEAKGDAYLCWMVIELLSFRLPDLSEAKLRRIGKILMA